MSDKWHEMLDHLVNKNEDQAKEAFKSIIDNEKESFVAQDAVESEVVESLSPADEKSVKDVVKGLKKAVSLHDKQATSLEKLSDQTAVKDVVKGLKKAVSLHSKQATSLEKLLKAGKDKSLKTKEDPKDSKDSE